MRALLACLAVVTAFVLVAAAPPEPSGYRLDDYRSPTPATLQGAKVLSTEEARAHWEKHDALFIDVLPQAPKPVGLPAGTVWHRTPRNDIPGSIWLPDTGYGALAQVMEDYFEHGLHQATGGDSTRLIVFYCQANCWMSWNAAKRAIALGYENIAWYPDGTDGWTTDNLPLELRPSPERPQAAE